MRASAGGLCPRRRHQLLGLGRNSGRRFCLPRARPSCDGERSPSQSPGSPRRERGRERSPRARPVRGSAQSAGALAGARRRYGRRSCERPGPEPHLAPDPRGDRPSTHSGHTRSFCSHVRGPLIASTTFVARQPGGLPDVQVVRRLPETAWQCTRAVPAIGAIERRQPDRELGAPGMSKADVSGRATFDARGPQDARSSSLLADHRFIARLIAGGRK